MRIAGIDPDTHKLAIAWFEEKTGAVEHGCEIVTHPPMRESRAEHRLLPLYDAACAWLETAPRFDYAYIERPVIGKNRAGSLGIAAVVAVLRLALRNYDIEHSLVDNKTWKSGTTGNGNASKEDVAKWAQINLHLPDNLPQDAYDAYCIAWWGYRAALPATEKGKVK